jgi:small GTP-binding protein
MALAVSTDRDFARVILIGDSGVGKTSLIIRGTTDTFCTTASPTIGAGVTPMKVNLKGVDYNFHLWDTAGQEIYRSIVPLYFKNAVCAILVFSLDDVKSFANLPSWIDTLRANSDREVPIVVVGNKTDLKKKMIDMGNARAWALKQDFPLFLTSAATGENVETLFHYIAESFIATQARPTTTALNANGSRPNDDCC